MFQALKLIQPYSHSPSFKTHTSTFQFLHFPILPFLQYPSSQGASYQTLQSNLSACAAALNVAGSEVMTAAKSTPEHQAEASAKFSKTFEEMLAAGLTLAGASKVREGEKEGREEGERREEGMEVGGVKTVIYNHL